MKAEGVKRMNGELNHDFLNCTNSPCDSRTQSGDINDIYGMMECNFLRPSLAVFSNLGHLTGAARGRMRDGKSRQ